MKVRFEQVQGFSKQRVKNTVDGHLLYYVNSDGDTVESEPYEIPAVFLYSKIEEEANRSEDELACHAQEDLNKHVDKLIEKLKVIGEVETAVVSVFNTVILPDGKHVRCVSMLSIAGYSE